MRRSLTKRRRLFPCSSCDIERIQQWLEELHAQGWALEKVVYFQRLPLYAVFRQTTAQSVRYRLQPAEDYFAAIDGPYDALRTQQEAYREFGWDYVARLPDFYVFRTADPALPELHTDPKVQAMAMERLRARYGRGLKLTVLAWLATGRVILRDRSAMLNGFGPVIFGAYIVSLVLGDLYSLAKYQYYRQAVEALSAGRPLPPMKHSRVLHLLIWIAVVLFACAFAAMLRTIWVTRP